jgi:alpha-glucoside transport system substrate-binding protein
MAEAARRQEEAEASRATAGRRTRQLAVAALVAGVFVVLAGFAFAQRQEARSAQAGLDRIQTSIRLAVASGSNLEDDPQLSALLAIEAIKATADLGFATPEAVDAAHWSLQELGATYPVDDSTPTYVRLGPNGSTGVWGLAPHELAEVAQEAVAPRQLSRAECDTFVGVDPCPSSASTEGLDVFGGIEAYADAFSWTVPELVIAGGMAEENAIADFMASVHQVAHENGFTARYEIVRGPPRADIEAGAIAPIYVLAQPGSLPAIDEIHDLVELDSFLDPTRLEDEYSDYLLSLGRVDPDGGWPSTDGPLSGIIAKADAKSLIWTRRSAFTYEAPETWSEFEDTLSAIRSTGVAPICLTLQSFNVSGWPATDLVENLVMRSEGPEFYDAWVAHEVPFDHPAIVEAITRAGKLITTEGNLASGPGASAERGLWEAGTDLWLSENLRCVLTPMPSFYPGLFESDDDPLDKTVFRFPTIDPRFADSMVGGGTLVIAIEDRPEVRAVMSTIASPEWLSDSVEDLTPTHLSPNRAFDSTLYADPSFRTISELLASSIAADMYRFDASDLMPPQIGEDKGAFPEGMLRLFREATPEKVATLAQEIATEIEATWQAVESES